MGLKGLKNIVTVNADSTQVDDYWERICKTGYISADDLEHCSLCATCGKTLVEAIQSRKLKVTAKMMANLEGKLKDEVVRAVCLRAVGSSLLN